MSRLPRRPRSGRAPGSGRPRSGARSPGARRAPWRVRAPARRCGPTRSATPLRPSDRSAAYVVKPRARRECSGSSRVDRARVGVSMDEVSRPDPECCSVGVGMGAKGDADVEGDVEPLVGVGRPRVGTLRAGRQVPRDGDAAAQSPKAPSTWSHAPAAEAASAIGSSSSQAPVFTSPSCAQTIVGPPHPQARRATRRRPSAPARPPAPRGCSSSRAR